MIRNFFLILILLATFPASANNPTGAVATVVAEKRIALVIGNTAYQHVITLPNARGDAQAIADELSRLGFEVDLKFDLKKSDTDTAFAKFSNKAEKAQVALLYYAGHGVQDGNKNYFVPIDARLKSDRDLKREATSLDDSIDDIRAAKVKLVFFDACRNNPFPFNRDRGLGNGLAAPSEASGTLISFATKHGTVADDGEGEHSPYTTALLSEMRIPGIEIHAMLRNVSRRTKEASNGRQVPWTYGALDGDFYLFPASMKTSKTTTLPAKYQTTLPRGALNITPVNRVDEDNLGWLKYGALLLIVLGAAHFVLKRKSRNTTRSALSQNSIDITTLWEHTQNGPANANPADVTLAPNPATIELKFWDSIKESQDKADFIAYINKYPDGQFTILAKNKVVKLEHGTTLLPKKLPLLPESAPSLPTPPKDSPTPNLQAMVSSIDGARTPEMLIVPAGSVCIGSTDVDSDSRPDEKPSHLVTIPKSFAVGRYPVTFAEWDVYQKNGGARYSPSDNDWGRDDRPVVNVSWAEVHEYIAWLNQYTGNRYRLLSESEWEYCCRSGTLTTRYWGNDIGVNQANYLGRAVSYQHKQSSPVGRFPANNFGLYDMLGNVWEWVEDNYHPDYQHTPNNGKPYLDNNNNLRVIRGGSCIEVASNIRSARRNWCKATELRMDCGFRVAMDLTT